MKTFMAKKEEQTPRWFVIDANGKVVGRVAVQAANILRGKHNPKFTAHVDTGDFVIVVNAAKCVFTGKKETDKQYMTYSQYPGNEKRFSPKQLRGHNSEDIIRRAVRGMIPHNRLGRATITKLKVYAGAIHPHVAQQPAPLAV
ncbi:MAG: 50S ribosomal protein L13 [Verrucomicrobiota bacterium]